MKYLTYVCLFGLASSATALAQDTEEANPLETDDMELIAVDELPDAIGSDVGDVDEFADEQYEPDDSPKDTDMDELRRNFELYKEALANASYDEADVLAKRMVELSIRLYGLDSHESAKALTNLGLVQQKNQDFESAILNFVSAIEIIERIEDRLNSNLINPLRGLGSAQLGAGRPDLARQSFNRAVHVSHVNEGPHNLMQIDVLEDLAETYLAMGEQKDAIDVHERIYNVEARNTDLDSEEIIPALERQADFLHRMRMYDRERMTWRRVISILEDSRGKRDLSLIPPLTGLAKSYLYVSEMSIANYSDGAFSTGDAYLKRAVRIAEENPDTTWSIQKQTILGLADYYTLSARASKARRLYEDVWNLLSEDEDREAARRSALEQPHVLQRVYPPKYFNSVRSDDGSGPPENFEVGTIVVGYRVTDRGATRDLTIIDASPAGLEDFEYAVSREVRRLIHRPRMEDGILVDTPDQTYVHEFYYRPSDLVREPAEDATASETVVVGEN